MHAVIIDEMADEDTAITATLPTHIARHSASVVSASVAEEEASALTLSAPGTAFTFTILPPVGILVLFTVDATAAGEDSAESCWKARSIPKSDIVGARASDKGAPLR